ncbi:MAG: O-antigen ligase family protein [Desulfobacterales bacterium]|nr:O-antigen ligase family protein [Desulfobacterales bacterium]
MSLKLSKSLFFFLFIFSPLAFGTTEPWSYAIMESVTGTALFFFLFRVVKHRGDLYHVPGLLPLALFLGYILFQLIPLPPFIIQAVSPQTFAIHQANQLITGDESWMALTVHPKATLTEFFRYGTYVIFYILTVQLLCNKTMLQTTAFTITVFGGLLAFSSILQFYLTEDMALWFRHSPVNSIVVGPYANHNHYAGLMEMIFPITLGLFLFYRPRIGNTSILKGIAEIFSQEKANIHILIGAAALLVLVSIFVSLSRGAMISTCLSLVVFTYLLMKRKISRGNTMLIIGVIMISAVSIGWFGWDQIFDRFAALKKAQGVIYEARLDFWKDTKEIIRDHPVTGTGMGTFSHIYPLYRSYQSDNYLSHAHNDYLEMLSDGGMIGFGLAAAFLLTLFYKTFQVFSRRRDGFSIYLYIGSITGMVSILFHSFTDFNLHIGANGLWFFLSAGIAVSAANTGIRKQSRVTRLSPVTSLRAAPFSCMAALIFALSVFTFNISNLGGIFYFSNIKDYTLSPRNPPDMLEKSRQVAAYASRFDPLHPEYPFFKANTSWFLNEPDQAKRFYTSALNLDPLNARYLNRFARFSALQGESESAELAFKKSMQYARSQPEYTFEYATWLFTQKEYDSGLAHMKQALVLDSELIERALTSMIIAGIDKERIEKAIPDAPAPSLAFAKYLFDTGNIIESFDRYIETLDLIENQAFSRFKTRKQQERKKRYQFLEIYQMFAKHGDMRNAMHVLRRAETHLPLDSVIKAVFGDFYYRQGILYKAKEKYDYALLLDPKNQRALRMIQKINQ